MTTVTDYYAKLIAYELTLRQPPDSDDRLAGTVASAQVDLNPHQVDPALFAFKSPLSTGALLADEVGLGKTIEAGLVISEKWAERKRRILVVTPANLRKQWLQELTEKLFLLCRILEAKSYNLAVRDGRPRPFETTDVVICSYQFACSKATDIRAAPWDLVVIDEAHRLRNEYKPSNVIANTLKTALTGTDKLLLTATRLQNSLLELFGLVSFIDEHAFGDLQSFKEQFGRLEQGQVFTTLKSRLAPLCHRTLRRRVTAYVPFTRRLPLLEQFTPEEAEDELYALVSTYLQRPNLQALPSGQRALITLVLRKLLASSTFAIAGALARMAERLKAKLQRAPPSTELGDDVTDDYETLDETADEWTEDPQPEWLTRQGVWLDETALQHAAELRQADIQRSVSERNARFFADETEKLDNWADDLKVGLEREIKDLDREIRDARRGATAAATLEDKLAAQRHIKALEAQRNKKPRSLFDAQDQVEAQRDAMIAKIEGRLQQAMDVTRLFFLRWSHM